jgi:hypothetical protein
MLNNLVIVNSEVSVYCQTSYENTFENSDQVHGSLKVQLELKIYKSYLVYSKSRFTLYNKVHLIQR